MGTILVVFFSRLKQVSSFVAEVSQFIAVVTLLVTNMDLLIEELKKLMTAIKKFLRKFRCLGEFNMQSIFSYLIVFALMSMTLITLMVSYNFGIIF